MQERDFDLGDVLSITTGRLVSPRHIGGVYDILGFMTGEDLFTHQLPRASDQMKPQLRDAFPQLANVDTSALDDLAGNEAQRKSAVGAWLDDQKAIYGDTLTVVKPFRETPTQNPIDELCDMVGAEKVFVIPIPESPAA